MKSHLQPVIFGEVLLDSFPDGTQVIGGAPFNVAWHMQAMGLHPIMISRVGGDPQARQIRAAMHSRGMSCVGLQMDSLHPTGVVQVSIDHGEPHYDIVAERAYDYIDATALPKLPKQILLYHGSLALRNRASRQTLQQLKDEHEASVFLDVNLRSPWWNQDDIYQWMHDASWVKLNHLELQQLQLASDDLLEAGHRRIENFDLEGMLITCGEQGALALDKQGHVNRVVPEPVDQIVDTVGAGDAFTAVVLSGLIEGWPMHQTMEKAQQLASRIVTVRGALPRDNRVYQSIAG